MEDVRLLCAFAVSVAALVVLIARYSLSPFVALLIASVVLAISAGIAMEQAWEEFALGVGGVLSATAMVIGLGAMIGIMLERSGGAAAIANRLVSVLGPEHLGWTMLIVGLLVGIGVWFTVGLVLLVPIAISLARVARVSLLVPAMAMLAGLSAMHGLAPPHPGPLVAISLLGADLGRTIAWSLLVGSISAAVAGPLWWRWVGGSVEMPVPAAEPSDALVAAPTADFLSPLAVIVVPIALMLLGSVAASLGTADTTGAAVHSWTVDPLVALGHPTMAMLVGLMLAYLLLGFRTGLTRASVSKMTQESLFPVANVLLVVGAGAGFSKVLIASGVGETLAELAGQMPLPLLVLAWLIAAAFRVATGSATTAITAAGGIVSVMLADNPTINREFVVLALGAGSLTLSHVNDGGFWFVKEFFALTVQQTLRTWTVLETVLSVVALAVVLLLDSLIPY